MDVALDRAPTYALLPLKVARGEHRDTLAVGEELLHAPAVPATARETEG